MSEHKTFTPGYWQAAENKGLVFQSIRPSAPVIAEVLPARNKLERAANTRLLAASPAMFEILETLVSDYCHKTCCIPDYRGTRDCTYCVISRARKVLAKVKGEDYEQ